MIRLIPVERRCGRIKRTAELSFVGSFPALDETYAKDGIDGTNMLAADEAAVLYKRTAEGFRAMWIVERSDGPHLPTMGRVEAVSRLLG